MLHQDAVSKAVPRLLLYSGALLLSAATMSSCGLIGTDEDALDTGDCIESVPSYSGETVETVDCAKPGVLHVVWNEAAIGDTFPGNIDSMEMSCTNMGGFVVAPSQASWEADGDRNVLCLGNSGNLYTGDGAPPEEQPG